MKILYAVCSLGLGHATRSLPLIKALVNRGDEVYILSHSKALDLLKKELGGSVKEYIDYPGYPPLERGYGKAIFYFFLIGDLMRTAKAIVKERIFTNRVAERYGIEKIITDGRYGVFSLSIPSFIISHQLRFASLFFEKLTERSSEIANGIHFLNFKRILVPDFADANVSLSGKLSHNLHFIPKSKIKYIGPISSYKKIDTSLDVDYLFIISGFIADERKSFVSALFNQAKGLKGKKVFVLGNPGENKVNYYKDYNITAYSYVDGEERIRLMNRAKFIISRTGYTTIMDLAELEKKALLVPTPGMSEQHYLARFHKARGTFYTVPQNRIDIKRDLPIAMSFSGIKPIFKTETSIKNFLQVIN